MFLRSQKKVQPFFMTIGGHFLLHRNTCSHANKSSSLYTVGFKTQNKKTKKSRVNKSIQSCTSNWKYKPRRIFFLFFFREILFLKLK